MGTQVFGRNLIVASGPGGIVNGANFGYAEPWSITYSEPGMSQFSGATGITTFGGPDAANYKSILDTQRFTSPGPFSFTLGNLTPGLSYLLQFWVADYRGFPNDRAETIAAAGGNTNVNTPTLTYLDSDGPIHGQYAIGTWVADASSITFTVTATSETFPGYNAMQLRVVPEPSSFALLLFGISWLCLMPRKRAP